MSFQRKKTSFSVFHTWHCGTWVVSDPITWFATTNQKGANCKETSISRRRTYFPQQHNIEHCQSSQACFRNQDREVAEWVELRRGYSCTPLPTGLWIEKKYGSTDVKSSGGLSLCRREKAATTDGHRRRPRVQVNRYICNCNTEHYTKYRLRYVMA